MREGRPSTTATFVACARGAAGVDPFAERLVPRAFAPLARPNLAVKRLLSVEFMRTRTLAIDAATIAAVREGSRQLVVLGAGLCARAWRLPELADSIVYEVDHPATQRYKQTRLEGLEPKAREVRFVSVDFEKDDLGHELDRARHDRTARTTWIWEGVTPYLTPGAISGTLDVVRARSAKGSVLATTYYTARPREEAGPLYSGLFNWTGRVFSAIGEPIRGLMSVATMHELLEAKGFAVESDATNRELARRGRGGRSLLDLTERFAAERIVVAVAKADAV